MKRVIIEEEEKFESDRFVRPVLFDGANDFAPVNNGDKNFTMLITLVRR
jgi:hypothetical protein